MKNKDNVLMKQLIVLDSKNRINKEDSDGFSYQFKLNNPIKITDNVRLEQLIFQNSQYVFSSDKKTDKFIINNTPYTIQGKFNTIDDFVTAMNTLVQPGYKMFYNPSLFELEIKNNSNSVPFTFNEYYTDGKFMDLLGFSNSNSGSASYVNKNIPKLFSQTLTYISIPDFSVYNTYAVGSRPYTFIITSSPGFEIVYNNNTSFDNLFYVGNKTLDELTIYIRNNDGQIYTNNKGESNFIIVLSY